MASARLKALVAGLKELFGSEETMRMMSNPMVAEEISGAARTHTLAEIAEALHDAREASASRWGWVATRLRKGRRPS